MGTSAAYSEESVNYLNGVACPLRQKYESYEVDEYSDSPTKDETGHWTLEKLGTTTWYRCVPGCETDLHILIRQPLFWVTILGGLIVVFGGVVSVWFLYKNKRKKRRRRGW